jgi:YidC/Oxa1 family membrane protein insertase
MKDDQKRAFLAVFLSGLILFGWQYFFAPKTDYSQTMKKKSDETKTIKSEVDTNNNEKVNFEANDEVLTTSKLVNFEIRNKVNYYKINNFLQIEEATSFENDSHFEKYFTSKAYNLFFNFDGEFKSLSFALISSNDTSAALINENNNLKANVKINDKGFLEYSFTSTKPFKFKVLYNLVKTSKEEGSMFAFSQPKSTFGYYGSDYTSVPFPVKNLGINLLNGLLLIMNIICLLLFFLKKYHFYIR